MFAALALLVTLAVGWSAAAQTPAPGFTPAQRTEIVTILRDALRTDPTILRDAIAAMQLQETARENAAVRDTIARLGPALTANPGDPVAGNPRGDVTLVEFYDVRCPYCRSMLPVMAELLKRDPGLRVVYKDLPILGPPSVVGARALLAAQGQGGYFRLHDALMAGPPDLDAARLEAAATGAGLDWERLQRDMAGPEVQSRLAANLALGQQLHIEGTPAYIVGGRMIPGATDITELLAAVDEARRAK